MVGTTQMKIMLINVFIQVIGFVFLFCGFVIGNGIIFASILLQFFYCLIHLCGRRNININDKGNVGIEDYSLAGLSERYFTELEELVVDGIIDAQNSSGCFQNGKKTKE